MRKNHRKNSKKRIQSTQEKVTLLWTYLQQCGQDGQQYSRDDVAQWFANNALHKIHVNGRQVLEIWTECMSQLAFSPDTDVDMPHMPGLGRGSHHGSRLLMSNPWQPGMSNVSNVRNGNSADMDQIDSMLAAAGSFVTDTSTPQTTASTLTSVPSSGITGSSPQPLTCDTIRILQRPAMDQRMVGDSPATVKPLRGFDALGMPKVGVPHESTPVSTRRRSYVEPDNIVWIDPYTEEIGTFFVNKIFIDSDSKRFYVPKLPNEQSLIKVLSFENLVPTDFLVSAFITAGCSLERSIKDGFIEHFPQSTALYVLVQEGDVVNISVDTIIACTSCPELITPADVTSRCLCSKCRRVNLRRYPANHLQAKFMLLRYTTRMRFIVLSASLNKVHWQRCVQFGWFCNFPIVPGAEETTAEERRSSAFQADLNVFLRSLCLPADSLLENVDFSNLSPAVNLLLTVPGVCNGDARFQFGEPRVHHLTERVPRMKDDSKLSFYHTTHLGSRKIGHIINSLFRLPISIHKNPPVENFRAIYPSTQRVMDCLCGIPADDAQVLQSLFENKDRVHSLDHYLYNHSDGSVRLLHNYNLACQYQVIEGDSRCKQPHCYGWLVAGSHSIGVGAWGDVETKFRKATFYLHHLGVAIIPYMSTSQDIVHALDLSVIWPFIPYTEEIYSKSDTPFRSTGTSEPHAKYANSGKDLSRKPLSHQSVDLQHRSDSFRPHIDGIVDEDEMLNNCCKGGVKLVAEKFPLPTDAELNELSMNPLRIQSDMEWLESHVRAVSGGQLPSLVGPYSIPVLKARLESRQQLYVVGTELLRDSLSKFA